jgi:ACS family hexuronate transporter-like MFS transporter
VGGAIAPFLVIWLYTSFGTWRPAFLFTACLGFIWLLAWRKIYHAPERHPWVTKEELALIQEGRSSKNIDENAGGVPWKKLLRYRQTWGIVLGRGLLDPYWFMVAEWFAIYLVSKGVKIEDSVLGFWAPFLAADLGNFFGGGLSSWLIKRGWSVGKSRRTVVAVLGPSMLILILAAFVSNYWLLVALFAYSTFAYAACATIFLALPADAFHSRAVASVSGLSGMGAGIGTLISTYLIGRVADAFSFEPIIIAASIVPCVATVIIVGLVRARKQPDPEGILLQF